MNTSSISVKEAQLSAVDRIASALNESAEQPLNQLRRVVECLGVDKCLELLEETERIEEQGGMMVPDGTRRRTAGGVFFVLARRLLSNRDRHRIFGQPPAAAQKPPRPREAPPESSLRPIELPPARPRRRFIEVSSISRHQPPRVLAPLERRTEPTPLPPTRTVPSAPASPHAAEAVPGTTAAIPPSSAVPSRGEPSVAASSATEPEAVPVRKRRIVTIADLPGRRPPTESEGSLPDRQNAKVASATERDRAETPASPLPPKTRAELRVYLSELLSNQPVRERQRLLLELLLDDLRAAPVTYKYADLRTRLAVVSGQKLGCSTAVIAERVFGENSKRTRSRVEALLADGVDVSIVDQLLALTAKH
ncbi:MAG: hypothetical protein JW940_07265 [Polyangiaceae bacterium]|nr:hypothetical protein [Polyangiaceae bacterium]